MKTLVSILITCAMLSGCATAYTGPQPDFSKTGVAAQLEASKFEVGEAYGDVNLYSIEMANKRYYHENIAPIMTKVSPGAAEKLNHMQIGQYALWGFFAATMIMSFQPRDSSWFNTGYWVGLAGILGSGIYINVSGMHAAEEYNKVLKSKFAPTVGFSQTFP